MRAGGSRTILVVEDEEDSFFVLIKAVQKIGIPNLIRQVATVDLAMEYLMGTNRFSDRAAFPYPALVLLDIKMSQRTGHELLEWIRDKEELRGLVVVMLTSSRNERDVAEAYRMGANAYLVKPNSFDRTVEMMKAIDGFWLHQNRLIRDAE